MTIKVLFIARYRDEVMDRKVSLLARQPDLSVRYVGPRHWQEEHAQTRDSGAAENNLQRFVVPIVGRMSDPHRALYRTIRFGMERFQPHIIHAEEEPDSLAALQVAFARRMNCPRAKLILYSWQNVNRPKRWYVRWVLRTALRASDAILCANKDGVDLLRQQGYAGSVEILPAYGVDMHVFKPREKHGPSEDPFLIGYVGRLAPEKGIDLLLSAFSHISGVYEEGNRLSKPVELRIVGNGPERPLLEAQVSQCGLTDRVQFAGSMSPLQVAEYMGQLDALVLPSRSTRVWQEQFGRVLVEAMACKVPVIGAASGAIPEVIGDAGLIFPEGDEQALVGCLRRLIESPSVWHDCAERGYARVKAHYTEEHVVERTVNFYRRLYAAI